MYNAQCSLSSHVPHTQNGFNLTGAITFTSCSLPLFGWLLIKLIKTSLDITLLRIYQQLCKPSLGWTHNCAINCTGQCSKPSLGWTHNCVIKCTVQCSKPSLGWTHNCAINCTVQCSKWLRWDLVLPKLPNYLNFKILIYRFHNFCLNSLDAHYFLQYSTMT